MSSVVLGRDLPVVQIYVFHKIFKSLTSRLVKEVKEDEKTYLIDLGVSMSDY